MNIYTKGFLAIVCVILLAARQPVKAQLSVSGSPCVGSFMVFSGPGCTDGWDFGNANAGVHYRIESTSNTSRTVTWLKAINNVQVGHCGSYSSLFNVVDAPVTPTITLTANTTTVCSSSQANVTFTAHPVNPGSNPVYRWFVNGGAPVSEGAGMTTFSRAVSSIANGDQVWVSMNSGVQCYGIMTATSTPVTMNVTQAAVVSLRINTNRPTVCQGQGVAFWVEDPQNIGTSPTYQWYINGAERSSDTPNPQLGPSWLTIDSWNYGTNAVVTCKVTSSQTGCMANTQATSNAITVPLKAKTSFSAGIKVLPERQPMNYCEDDVSFQVTIMPENTQIAEIYWYKNNLSVGTNNSSSYKPAAFAQGDVVSVNVVANNDGCLTNTASTYTTANTPIQTVPRPSPPVVADKVILYNTAASLPASGASGNEAYQWFSDQDVLLSGDNPYTTPVLTSVTTTYRVRKYNTAVPECASNPSALVVTTNHAPVVTAGPDQDITLPVAFSSLKLTGSASDSDGTVNSVVWSRRSGPNITLSGGTTLEPTVSPLQAGTYVFRLTAYDNHNAMGYDEVTINIHYPPNNWNYVREDAVLIPGVTDPATIAALPVGKRAEKTSYFDGVGNVAQIVDREQSPTKQDVVQPKQYDQFGREYRKYLPFSSGTNGYYKPNTEIIDATTGDYTGVAAQFYSGAGTIPADARLFSETVFEASPLNRPIAEFGPGEAWGPQQANKYVDFKNVTNVFGSAAGQELIIAWRMDDAGELVLRDAVNGFVEPGGYYSTGTLAVKQTTDEDSHVVREYMNTSGQIILKRVQAVETTPAVDNDTHWAETYYVYNEFGELVAVLPPEATKSIKNVLAQQ